VLRRARVLGWGAVALLMVGSCGEEEPKPDTRTREERIDATLVEALRACEEWDLWLRLWLCGAVRTPHHVLTRHPSRAHRRPAHQQCLEPIEQTHGGNP
jgi:hypothetical protein